MGNSNNIYERSETMDFDLNKAMSVPQAPVRYFERYVDRDGCNWFVGMGGAPAHHIFKSPPERENKPGYLGFRGMGGRTLYFTDITGKEWDVQGPWHVTADSLYRSTGVDVRNTHVSWGCIALEREGNMYKNVVYTDGQFPKQGVHNRLTSLAVALSKSINEPVYLFQVQAGGSMDVMVDPWEEGYS